jgi:hypothetical protein
MPPKNAVSPPARGTIAGSFTDAQPSTIFGPWAMSPAGEIVEVRIEPAPPRSS